MYPKSLKSKLLMAVSAIVIGSGLLISLIVSHRYGRSLLDALYAQAENLGHAISLEATEKVLINDLVSLQKMLDHQMRSNPSLAYLFVLKDGDVLAHTFPEGIPSGLMGANKLGENGRIRFQEIASTDGDRYLDIAWPIFGGKDGVLRLGVSEKPYRNKIFKLWLQMCGLTLFILLISLLGTMIFVKRITSPLEELDNATKRIDKGELGVRVRVQSEDEVGRLANSFNQMVARIEEYTSRLEEKTMELERVHQQTQAFCGIVQEIGALRRINDIGSFLVSRFEQILKCRHMMLLIFNTNREVLYTFSPNHSRVMRDPGSIDALWITLEGIEKPTFTRESRLGTALHDPAFQGAVRHALIPLSHGKHPLGGLVLACPGNCRCNVKEVEVVGMILSQAAGVINRAVLQEEEIAHFQTRLEASSEFSGIIGKDQKMQMIYKLIEDIAPTDATVLIQGESGTGKELVARAIHKRSPRKDQPFIVINCSAYPSTLLESELFGHEKGAFTGAIRHKVGRFEQADGGTVFLDEIGEITPSAQIKLLRVLQTQKFERVGGEKTVSVDIRILAATNKDLLQEVKKGRFREDLFYRLNVIPINMPPLRSRRNDIPLLSRYFLRQFAAIQGKDVKGFTSEAMRMILDYPWPGNVRELENSIEHAVVLAKNDRIDLPDLPPVLRSASASGASPGSQRTITENERRLLQDVLEECGWNKKETARRLGISRSTLYDKIRRYQISKPTAH
ncbi:MAG: sigma 54-interacting transcriptional regulator [Deltaproteobacteria bacterium]|nr:sigma 54-interacting transcriptional regulator [Deltaproteobacteria bacterium]